MGKVKRNGVGGDGSGTQAGANNETINDGKQRNDGPGNAYPSAETQQGANLCAVQRGPSGKGQPAGGKPEHDQYSHQASGQSGGDEGGDAAMTEGDAEEREALQADDADDLAGIEGEEGLAGFEGARQDGDQGNQGNDDGEPGDGLLGFTAQRGRDLENLRKEPVTEKIENDSAQYAHARAEDEGCPKGAVTFLDAFLAGDPLCHSTP